MKKPIDHNTRSGGAYESKGAKTEEQRAALSEKMKEFNRKTGKATATANKQLRATKRAKPQNLK